MAFNWFPTRAEPGDTMTQIKLDLFDKFMDDYRYVSELTGNGMTLWEMAGDAAKLIVNMYNVTPKQPTDRSWSQAGD